jgi:hypothetical protein
MFLNNASTSSGKTIGTYFKALWSLYMAVVSGAVSATAVVFYLTKGSAADANPQFVYAGFAVAIMMGIGGLVIFRSLLLKAQLKTTLTQKLDAYRISYLLILATFEGAGLINMIFYFLNGDTGNFFVGLAMLVVMLTRYPSKPQMVSALQLNDQEARRLNDATYVLP